MVILGLFLCLGTLTSPAKADLTSIASDPSVDGWQFTRSGFKVHPLFSEFKYFNFQDRHVSAAITYSVISPLLSGDLEVNGYIREGGRIWSFHRVFPLSCVTASMKSLAADFCGQGGIQVEKWGSDGVRLRVLHREGPIQWDLTYDASVREFTGELTSIPISRLWHMIWSPVLRSARVTGTLRFVESGREIRIDTPTSYHDQNWQIWNPYAQPFNWLHFTAKDSRGEPVDLMLVEFPKSEKRAAGLVLYSCGLKRTWAPGTYRLTVEKEGRTSIARHAGQNADRLLLQTVDPRFAQGEHTVPVRYRIETNDGELRAELSVAASLSSTRSAKSSWRSSLVVDEQVLDVSVNFISPEGDLRTASGAGEFMRISTDRE